MKSIIKKASTILRDGIDPYLEGKKNFKNENKEVENLAIERSKVCRSCPSFKKEPIKEFRILDPRIPILSNRYCEDCGCVLSYKTRQSIQKCKLWKK